MHCSAGWEDVILGASRSEIGSITSELPSAKRQGITAHHVYMVMMGKQKGSANTPQSWGYALSQHTLIQIQQPMFCLQILMSALFFYWQKGKWS